jgi:hypothetical protein
MEIPAAGPLMDNGECNSEKVGRYQWAQVSKLLSMQICDNAVTDILKAANVTKFQSG